MLRSAAVQRLSARQGVGAGSSRFATAVPLTRITRRPCKPVCFKENTPDRIDDATSGRPGTTAPGGTPPRTYGTEPLVSATGLRAVNLGPVASMMYPLLTYGTLAASAAALLAPTAVSNHVFQVGTPTTVQRLMIMATGASLIPAFISKHLVKRAADAGILASPTYKQIVSACLLNGVLALVVLSQAVSLRNPVLAGTVGGLAGLATITTSYTLMKVPYNQCQRIRESGQLVPSAQGLLGGVLSLLTPGNLTATAYSAVTVGLLVAGTLFFTSDPTAPSLLFIAPKDAVQVFCSRIIGGATLANAVLLFSVKQAADDGRQGSPVFRTLNAAVGCYSAVTAGVLGWALATGWAKSVPAFWALGGLLGATSLLTAANWATAAP